MVEKWAKFLFDIGFPFDVQYLTDPFPHEVMVEVARLWWEDDKRPQELADYVDLIYSESGF